MVFNKLKRKRTDDEQDAPIPTRKLTLGAWVTIVSSCIALFVLAVNQYQIKLAAAKEFGEMKASIKALEGNVNLLLQRSLLYSRVASENSQKIAENKEEITKTKAVVKETAKTIVAARGAISTVLSQTDKTLPAATATAAAPPASSLPHFPTLAEKKIPNS